jgi:hypothetical protein
MEKQKVDTPKDAPHEDREVQSDRPYYEEASVPGDNDPNTAVDPELERSTEE